MTQLKDYDQLSCIMLYFFFWRMLTSAPRAMVKHLKQVSFHEKIV